MSKVFTVTGANPGYPTLNLHRLNLAMGVSGKGVGLNNLEYVGSCDMQPYYLKELSMDNIKWFSGTALDGGYIRALGFPDELLKPLLGRPWQRASDDA